MGNALLPFSHEKSVKTTVLFLATIDVVDDPAHIVSSVAFTSALLHTRLGIIICFDSGYGL